ncbi:MAG: histidinol-phosphatase [Treponema sp.]|nr:histidinol-phosphatase [Treponema sp.]
MKVFKYESHLHTSQASACASSFGRDYIKAYYDIGYSGIFVTDHFFGGNTAAPREADWETKVNVYCSGYEDALAEAQKFNMENNLTGTENEFKVFFGIEQTFNGDDYLVYGLDKKWLLEHPDVEIMRHKELFEEVNKVGGLMIQAHPFRLRDYIKAIHIHPREIHGVEIYNAGNQIVENELAEFYARKYDFPVTSGSDIHTVNFIPDAPGKLPLGGMIFDTPIKDVFDYAQRIKEKKGTLIK